jgi:glycerophosphoryl diester phosphodiesterase
MRPLLALVALVAACSSEPAQTEPVDAGEETSAPPLDPKLFDCTSLAKGPPARTSTTPEACLRDPSCKTRLVAGHRGAGGDLGRIAPEDTLAAYRAAIVLGVDLVETDPRPTKDGVIVNLHDDTLDRTTSGTGKVDQTNYDDIKKLTIDNTLGLAGDYSCERVPTLRELLELCRGRAMVLVDANKTDRVDLLVQAIKDANAVEWAIFDTSDTAKIDQALTLEPKLMIQPRLRDPNDATALLTKYKDHLPVFIEVEESWFPKASDVIHAAGTRVFVNAFTTDVSIKLGGDKAQYLEIYGKGADAVQSDLPDVVLQALGR